MLFIAPTCYITEKKKKIGADFSQSVEKKAKIKYTINVVNNKYLKGETL
ncbi:hypothetical protein K280104A7_33490 [Candidatus Bariatricus faecipullorum]